MTVKCRSCEYYHKYSEYITAGWCSERRKKVQWEDSDYKGFEIFHDCKLYNKKWIPQFTHHKCKNPLCDAELPMDAISVQWGGTLVSVMYECHHCGRLDGEIWDITTKECIVEKCYMESKYGEFEKHLLEILSKKNGSLY